MGWKGVLREVQRAAKRAEKEQQRREKERRKQRQRRAAASEVNRFKSYLEEITTIHTQANNPVDWESLRDETPPEEPSRRNTHEGAARKAYEEYESSWLDKLFKREATRRDELRRAIEDAKTRDQEEYEQAKLKYEQELSRWRAQQDLCERVLDGGEEGYADVLKSTKPFESSDWIDGLNSFKVHSADVVSATVAVRDEEIVPSERKRQLKSGKLSVTDMPKTKFYGYHQDYVCSSVIRVARDLHALLPIEMAVVTASTEMLNPATGHIEEQPILSAAIPNDTLENLNFDRISPSDAMSNFVHEMEFRKTKGFKATTSVDAEQFAD